jgi:aminoglycoside phosphotransferase
MTWIVYEKEGFCFMETVGQDFPIEFRKLIGDDQVTFCWENTARTYFIKSQYGENKYLKIQEVDAVESLDRQAKRLIWLYVACSESN